MHEAHYFRLDGRLGFAEVFGTTGPPVLCVHTAGQSGVQFRYAAPQIAALGYRAVVVDLPGHGRSEPAIDGPVSDLRVYGDWCTRVLDLLVMQDPYLLGCSIGGTIVMEMVTSARRPIVGAIAMAAADAVAMGHATPRPLRLEDSGSPSIRDRSYYGGLESCGSSVSDERREIVALMHCREDWNVTFADGTGMAALKLWNELARITCPMVVVAGKDDPFSPWEKVRDTAARIPGAHFELLEGIGHYPMEDIEDFGPYFARWVSMLGAVPAR